MSGSKTARKSKILENIRLDMFAPIPMKDNIPEFSLK